MTHPTAAGLTRRQLLEAGVRGAAVVAGALAGTSVVGCGEGARSTRDALDLGGTLLDPPLTKPAESFTDVAGRPFDLVADTAGRLSLWFFGYSNCPDVCPVTLGVLAASIERLEGRAKAAQVCFVGVDTVRDTPERLRTYLADVDRDFVGLTAAPEIIDRTMAALNLPAPTFDRADGEVAYSVGHPSQVLAFTRDDRCHVVYPFGTRRQTWLHDLPLLAEMRWRGAPR